MTGYFDAAPRPLRPGESEAVRGFVWAALGVTPYVDRVAELLDAAEHADPESRALVIERDGTIASLALFGPVAGAVGAWHLYMVLVAPRLELKEVGRAMIDAVVNAVRREGGRLLVAELSADAALGRTLT
ncbi:MAG TPA: GNAT family N-acetyltransferase, partial [Gemmatimonadaceae bacterium]|nr:GNAT family N-acetyltransferase [Gemmatimonadaceae bacterium]